MFFVSGNFVSGFLYIKMYKTTKKLLQTYKTYNLNKPYIFPHKSLGDAIA